MTSVASVIPNPVPPPPPTHAPRVCAACKRRKKKCDKQLPSCSSCITQRIGCDYRDEKDIPGIADDLRSLRKWLRRAESSMLVLNNASSSPENGSDKPSPGNLTSLLPDFLIWQADDERFRVQKLHEAIHKRVCQIFELGGDTINDVCELYFKSVHFWLPVISKKLFYDRLRSLQTLPQADFSLLLLTVYLLVQVPSDEPEIRDNQHQLYLTAKHFCTSVQIIMPASISLMQAKLMIATYEHTTGKCEPAYLTIGECARNGFLMGLDKNKHTNYISGTDEFLQASEAKNLWWGIINSERIIVLETQIFGRPLATKAPDLKYGLPIDLEDLSMNPNGEARSKYETSFQREARASRLLDEIICFVTSSQSFDEGTHEFMTLDQKLHSFLNFLMDPATEAWGTFCGSTAIIISGFFVLHRTRKARAGNNATAGPRFEQAKISTLALCTATRIVLDVLRQFMMQLERYDIKAIPPGYTSIVFQGAMNHITASDYFGTDDWQVDLELFRRSLFYMSCRWRIAREYLTIVDGAANAVSPKPLEDFGEFIMPSGTYNGLC